MKSALKNKKKIETIFDKGFVIKAKGLLLKGYDFNDDEKKFGVSVSKKSFPTAVKRNLIMRGAFKIWMDNDDMHNALVDILANDMFTRNV